MEVKKPISFNVDHMMMDKGIYINKIDYVGDYGIVTLDVRIRKPYLDDVISLSKVHTYEHCFATAIRMVSETHFDKGEIDVIYWGPMGCFSKGTKITMADRSFKSVEDVGVGDYVMGDDFSPREVINLIRGRDMMYRVHQSNNEDYIVNGKHKLCLEYNRNEKRYGCSKGDKVVVSVEEFLSKSDEYRDSFRGYKRSLECENENLDTSKLDITPVGINDYYGFETDGNEQFLLKDGTVVHNCQTGYYLILKVKRGISLNKALLYMWEACLIVRTMTEVPGSKIEECGNAFSLVGIKDILPLNKELSEIVSSALSNGFSKYSYL